MRIAHAVLSVDGRGPVTCYPGDLIGRLSVARLRLEDPTISEAHALVSAREDRLWLLYLRKPVSFDGKICWQLPLSSGTRLPLTPQLHLEVHAVWMGRERLVVSVDGAPSLPLAHTKYALRESGLVDDDEGPFVVWSSGDAFFVRDDTGVHELAPGEVCSIGRRTIEARVECRDETTWTEVSGVAIPLTTISATPEVCSIEDERGVRAELRGQKAEVFYSLARHGGRATWRDLARDLWGRRGEEHRDNLMNNVLWRLDGTLRSLGLRDDLIVRVDGNIFVAERVNISVSMEVPPAGASSTE